MKRAFTLIELLVVIAIIALLSTLSVVALNSARAKSRDARRLSDINQIRTALEMYYDSVGTYPTELTAGSPLEVDGGLVFLAKVPSDPQGNAYKYQQINGGHSYTIKFTLEVGGGAHQSGNYQATQSGVALLGGGGGTTPPEEEWTCGDPLVDSDSNTYTTAATNDGEYCVMTQNLKRQTDQRRCFNDDSDSCEKCGGFYPYNADMCPADWQLPDDSFIYTSDGVTKILLNSNNFCGFYSGRNNKWNDSDCYIMIEDDQHALSCEQTVLADYPAGGDKPSAISIRCIKKLN